MNFLPPEQFKKGLLKHINPPESIPHEDILDKLLEMVETVDFHRETESDKLNQKHYLVIVVEKVLQLATKNNWGLCKKHDFIYLYNGAYWHELEESQLEAFLGAAAKKMGVDRIDADFFHFREKLLKQFRSSAHLPTPEKPDDLVLINLKNGTVEINSESSRPVNIRNPQRTDFLTYQLSFEYDPDKEAPRFQRYLDEVLPKKDIQKILAEFIGYVFVSPSTLKLEKALLLYGTGANGKSVFFEIINALLGNENVSNATLQDLTSDKAYFRAQLEDNLLNYASEINGKMETGLFKQLVSGEPVQVRLPYGDPFTITDYAKLLFNCNELPSNVEHNNAFFRRFIIIPFEVTIPQEKQDKKLASKIIDNELSGVFNWVLEGLRRLLKQQGFTESEVVERQINKFRRESDSVLLFISERGYTKSVGTYISLSDLYRKYKGFCGQAGHYAVSKRKFSKRLKNGGFKVKRKSHGNVVYLKN